MVANHIHHGHIDVIKRASSLGELTVGLLTDSVFSYGKELIPTDYEKRKSLVRHLKGVENVIPQESLECDFNLKNVRPHYFLQGDIKDWFNQDSLESHKNIPNILKEWGGQIIDSAFMHDKFYYSPQRGCTTSNERLGKLRKLLDSKSLIRVLEVHSALTGLIAEELEIKAEGNTQEFDAMWSSSLTDSISKGKPDIEVVDLTSRTITINNIFEVTTKPLIFDADTGGMPEHFAFTVKTLERLGVSAVIIEDKTGLKKNSLFGNDVLQTQASIEEFSHKIQVGKKSQITYDFMIIARIESLILEKGMEDALCRALAYISAGADGIMIHSREREPGEILEFCRKYKTFDKKVPLVVVPTSYNKIFEHQLIEAGVQVVIYANHMLRASYPNMLAVAKSILENGRSAECEHMCMSINDILTLIPENR
ncbi:MAG: phosphoenolpyruvate mutase [Alphaproteobacteria bacterium]|nr:phosphoenolpyruvate mutase [Alphaproteobacteria bacterium]